MQLDAGGIAKGYAADAALEVLRSAGYGRSLVAAGGDLAIGDPPPDRKGWTVALEGLIPDHPAPGSPIVVSRCGVSTSGDEEQWVEIGGVRYSHIIDARTGAALTGRRSVTVIAPAGTLSDGLATAVSVLGPARGLALVAKTPGASASISFADGGRVRTVTSPGWRYFAAAGSGPISTRRNSTSDPSA